MPNSAERRMLSELQINLDFGSLDLAGRTFFWKIDDDAPDLDGGSDDPAETTHVPTIMLAKEY